MKIRYILVGIFLVGCVVGAVRASRQQAHSKLEGDRPLAAKELQKAKGPEDAKATIVEFSDFQCPACQAAEPVINDILKRYDGKIRFVFRHFPLPGHVWSGLAHQAAECANLQGKFWEYHDKLYDAQKDWSTPKNPAETFMEYANALNLNLDSFAACLTDPKTAERVSEDRRYGEQMQVQSTPTFFVNGERFAGPFELKLKADSVIEKALGIVKAQPTPVAASSLSEKSAVLATPVASGSETKS